jgi:hypothetical protein
MNKIGMLIFSLTLPMLLTTVARAASNTVYSVQKTLPFSIGEDVLMIESDGFRGQLLPVTVLTGLVRSTEDSRKIYYKVRRQNPSLELYAMATELFKKTGCMEFGYCVGDKQSQTIPKNEWVVKNGIGFHPTFKQDVLVLGINVSQGEPGYLVEVIAHDLNPNPISPEPTYSVFGDRYMGSADPTVNVLPDQPKSFACARAPKNSEGKTDLGAGQALFIDYGSRDEKTPNDLYEYLKQNDIKDGTAAAGLSVRLLPIKSLGNTIEDRIPVQSISLDQWNQPTYILNYKGQILELSQSFSFWNDFGTGKHIQVYYSDLTLTLPNQEKIAFTFCDELWSSNGSAQESPEMAAERSAVREKAKYDIIYDSGPWFNFGF